MTESTEDAWTRLVESPSAQILVHGFKLAAALEKYALDKQCEVVIHEDEELTGAWWVRWVRGPVDLTGDIREDWVS